ncbi:hypothetical protein ABIA35_000830 [Catenulispora sp. MAP12-49]|uniref:hypothetical protein n=1 Tax=Catenulispora sp. MAP12-49 TaxID=3156302 RepID=UPI003518A86C
MVPATLITFVAVVLFIAVVAAGGRRGNTKREVRTAFGPEYARVRSEYGGTRAADRELARRNQMYGRLRLEPVSANDRDLYISSWERLEGRFLEEPTFALAGAGQLLDRLLEAKGYPVDDRGEQLALLSVRHGGVLAGYRQALWVSERLRADPASLPIDVKREALMLYRALFDDLLTARGAVVPGGTR